MQIIKKLWQLAPRVLRSLIIATLIVTLTGGGTAVLGARSQPSQLQRPDPNLIARAIPGKYTIPPSCSVPIIPSVLTEEEIQLRQYLVDFAKYIEEQAELDLEANLTVRQDVLGIEKFRLECEIMVLQAQQILQTNNQHDSTPSIPEPNITTREVALRQRQFDIAKQIDADELVSHEAGLVSLNRVWTARRTRTDAEILLLQAIVQRDMQNKQTSPE